MLTEFVVGLEELPLASNRNNSSLFNPTHREMSVFLTWARLESIKPARLNVNIEHEDLLSLCIPIQAIMTIR